MTTEPKIRMAIKFVAENNMLGSRRSLEASRDLNRYTNRVGQLRSLENIFPTRVGAESFFWNDYHVTRLEGGVFSTTAEQTAGAADHRTVSANHEDSFLVRGIGGSTRLSQIPAGALAGFERNGSGVVHSAIDHDQARPLRNVNRVPGPNLDIG